MAIKDIKEAGTYVDVPTRRINMEQKWAKNIRGGVFPPNKKAEYAALHICAA